MQVDLVHTTLTACADIYDHYTALSYVWGDPNNTSPICVDGNSLSITMNLYSALRDLRHESRALLVWAICINQRDDEEKLKQIAMMGRIYSPADHTVIYLGPIKIKDEKKCDSWASTIFDGSHSSSEILESVLNQAWFRRVWVFQELVFSKDPIVQVGKYRVPWALYHRMTRSIESGYSGGSPEVLQGSKLLNEMHRARENHQKAVWSEGKVPDLGLTMLDLLRARRGLGVTDPKDMIFAHLGFASDGEGLKRLISYSMSWAEVYHSVARWMSDRVLFSEVDDSYPSERLEGLASRAPDWSTRENRRTAAGKPRYFRARVRRPGDYLSGIS